MLSLNYETVESDQKNKVHYVIIGKPTYWFHWVNMKGLFFLEPNVFVSEL